MIWRHAPISRNAVWRCEFQYDNPEPPPEPCDCDDPYCDCGPDYEPVIRCPRGARVTGQLANGPLFLSCSPEAHGVAPVAWWAPLVGPRWEPPLERLMKYIYPVTAIAELDARPHPLVSMMMGRDVLGCGR